MRQLILACLTLISFSRAAGAADTMRCGSRIVSTEDLVAEVLAACGEPDYRDYWYGYGSDVEQWYYNFGPNQLLRVLWFRNGQLERIDADGYGFSQPPSGHCSPYDIVEGMSKFRLLLDCGEPVTRESQDVLAPFHPHAHAMIAPSFGDPRNRFLVPVHRERWVYNFGSRNLLRVVILENGIVTDIDNAASRGYDDEMNGY